MTDLDCYIFIDPSVSEEKRTIEALCVECRNQKMPDSGFFYEGSKEGYSDYDWQCSICKKYIHKADERDEETEGDGEDESYK
jgi:hypothetical protein